MKFKAIMLGAVVAATMAVPDFAWAQKAPPDTCVGTYNTTNSTAFDVGTSPVAHWLATLCGNSPNSLAAFNAIIDDINANGVLPYAPNYPYPDDYVGRINVDDGLVLDPANPNGTVEITFDGQNGTWESFVENWDISYIVVKGGTGFAVYDIDPDSDAGLWTTIALLNNGGQIPDLSHIDFYGTRTDIPEPATLMLLGTGLAGIVLLRRRRRT